MPLLRRHSPSLAIFELPHQCSQLSGAVPSHCKYRSIAGSQFRRFRPLAGTSQSYSAATPPDSAPPAADIRRPGPLSEPGPGSRAVLPHAAAFT